MKRKKLTPEERKTARKAVLRKYYLKNKEKILAYTKKHAKKNRSKSAENLRKWRKENRVRFIDSTQKWMKGNIDKRRASSLRNYYRNKEKAQRDHRAWMKLNPDKSNYYNSKRRKDTKAHLLSNNSMIRDIYKEAHRLSDCFKIKFCVDHIIPISKGGFHHEDNLQSLPKFMNESKHGDPFWIAPMGFKDWRDVPRELWPIELKSKYIALIEQNKGTSIRWDAAA